MLTIAESGSNEISYDTTLLNVFKGDEVALQQLVSLDIIGITYKDGVPDNLRAGMLACTLLLCLLVLKLGTL